jgi:hypothetical protein
VLAFIARPADGGVTPSVSTLIAPIHLPICDGEETGRLVSSLPRSGGVSRDRIRSPRWARRILRRDGGGDAVVDGLVIAERA